MSVDINGNWAKARQAQADGGAAYTRITGQAEADRVQAVGLAEAKATEALGAARAAGFAAQREAIGEMPTALGGGGRCGRRGQNNVVPDILVTGNGSSLDGLAATLMRKSPPGDTRPCSGWILAATKPYCIVKSVICQVNSLFCEGRSSPGDTDVDNG